MNPITVGRDRSCDIILNNPRISRLHAKITLVNGSYVYEDLSTNGTSINGVFVKSKSVNVRPGDNILLATTDSLPWPKVQMLLPITHAPRPDQGNNGANNLNGAGQAYAPVENNTTPSILDKWSWGGFFFGWIWAVFNGTYWPLLTLIPVIGTAAGLIVAIILGIKGNRMAWANRRWQSVEHFEKSQKQWAKAALIIVLISIVSTILFFVLTAVFAAAAISSL